MIEDTHDYVSNKVDETDMIGVKVILKRPSQVKRLCLDQVEKSAWWFKVSISMGDMLSAKNLTEAL